jgi:hypothetical protein
MLLALKLRLFEVCAGNADFIGKIIYTMHVQIFVNPLEFRVLTARKWLIDKSGYRLNKSTGSLYESTTLYKPILPGR